MHPQVRTACSLAILVVVLSYAISLPGPLLRSSDAPEPFPAAVAAPASPVPLVHTERADLRVAQLVASMEGMWRTVFTAAGDDYAPARIDTSADSAASDLGCGAAPSDDWAGLYCPRTERILIDLGDHRVLRAAAGDELADDLLGYVLAHEIGHHVQYLRGAPGGNGSDVTLRRELHAECLAGVWGRAAGRRPPPPGSYASDATHGTAEQQRRWLERGHASGLPASCDVIWSASGL